MSKKTSLKPIMAALGTTFVVSLTASPIVNAAENPFSLNELSGGFMVAGEEGKCGTICGGANPTVKDGEMVKCGGTCGEVQKCGSICGGTTATKPGPESKDTEVAKCGNICAAVK
ncbi:MAG: hypothetical protein HY356_05755 [Gammaproteobacteria bacterium]|nr:hypothetical protein [Gammaproteobacteria bacterium]